MHTGPAIVRDHRPSDDTALLAVLAGMSDQPYPGTLAGATNRERHDWLTRAPAVARWVAILPPGLGRLSDGPPTPIGHIQVAHPSPALVLAVPASVGTVREVGRLFVAPHARRSGAGRALLAHAVAFVRATGATPVLCVSDYLTPAIALYQAEGWQSAGAIRSPLDGDRLLVFLAPD